jgi:hypothetical protein
MHLPKNVIVTLLAFTSLASAMPVATNIEISHDNALEERNGCYTDPDSGENICTSKAPYIFITKHHQKLGLKH